MSTQHEFGSWNGNNAMGCTGMNDTGRNKTEPLPYPSHSSQNASVKMLKSTFSFTLLGNIGFFPGPLISSIRWMLCFGARFDKIWKLGFGLLLFFFLMFTFFFSVDPHTLPGGSTCGAWGPVWKVITTQAGSPSPAPFISSQSSLCLTDHTYLSLEVNPVRKGQAKTVF